jgi:hypothetical protein
MASANLIQYATPLLPEFPDLVALHLRVVPGTKELEEQGRNLITSVFSPHLLQNFIRDVHQWGATFRNLETVLQNAKPSHFISAWNALSTQPPMVGRALDSLMEIRGLGISYSSKHLRFLCPEYCPILDSNICKEFKYSEDSKGYRKLHSETMQIARLLEANKKLNPMERPDGKWYAGDVDMAIFASIQRKNRKPSWV